MPQHSKDVILLPQILIEQMFLTACRLLPIPSLKLTNCHLTGLQEAQRELLRTLLQEMQPQKYEAFAARGPAQDIKVRSRPRPCEGLTLCCCHNPPSWQHRIS